jgi:chorismate synthase
MRRRAPGQTAWSTPRQEKDEPEILSGLFEGRTTGTPLMAVIRNTDTRSGDYSALMTKPRPGHADLTGMARYLGFNDPRGSGLFLAA